MDHHTQEHLHESPWVVTFPLIALAIPSAIIGWITVQPMLFGDFFDGTILCADANNVLEHVGEEFDSSAAFLRVGFMHPAGVPGRGRGAHRLLFFFKVARAGPTGRKSFQVAVHASWSISTTSTGSTST